MTIIYNKRIGKIKVIYSGDINHVSTAFGAESQDYMLIYDEIILPDDKFVMYHPQEFEVNPITKELEILTTAVNDYAVKSSG